MKKILALLVCLLTISTGVCADDDRPVRFDQLPAKAQAYVKKYFPQEKVALAKMEKDFFDKKYEVIFANSSKYSTVPEAVIPEAILRYVKATYPDHKVVKIEKEDRGYEAKLANGMKLEFDNKFNLIDIDN